MQKLKHNLIAQLLIIYARYILGGALVFASLIKIKGRRFTTESGLNEPIDTAWHLFETLYQSGLYWQFIGLGQLLAGFLLLTQRYSKLGALISLPITTNIFIITLSYYFAFTPVITGGMLLANILLLAWDWDSLRVLLNLPHQSIDKNRLENAKVWETTGLLLFAFTFIYRVAVDKYDVIFWAVICFLIGIVGFGVGMYQNSQLNSNRGFK